MPTTKPGRNRRTKSTSSKPQASPNRRSARAGSRVSVGRDLHCADFIGRDQTIHYHAPANLEQLIARLLEFLKGGAVFERHGDVTRAELKGETLAFRQDAIGALMQGRSPRAYWLGLIVNPQHSIWSTLFVPLRARADVARTPLEIRLNYKEYIPATGPESQPRTEDLEDITEAVHKHRAFVILGDAGGGKTTTLRRLALDHAKAALANDPAAPAPFLVRLSEQGDQSPYDFLSAKWRQYTGGDFGDALLAQRLLILADGLNELPRDPDVRRARLRAWREFVLDDAGRNQFVFTSRERGEYAGELELPNVRVEPLDPEQIVDYLRRWKAEGLLPRLEDPKSRLGELARNPFYLNLLVNAYHDDAALLENRGRLLRQFVRRLWEREERLARKDWISTRVQEQALTALAYAMQVQGVNLTLKNRAAAALTPTAIDLDDDEPVVVKPMALFRLARAELLLDPALEQDVRFYHQLLQEYFAAEALLARFEAGEDERAHWRARRRADEMPPAEGGEWDPLPEPPGTGWEETTILACGLAAEPERLIEAVRAHHPNLAARCWLESGVDWGDAREAAIKPQLQQDLLADLVNPDLHLRTRLQAGHTLGWLGDPRFETQERAGVRFIAPTLVPVPAGPYTLGSADDDPDAFSNERPQHTVELEAFAIGQWPVTNAEFACFIAAGGYQDEQWWETELARRWLRGEDVAGGQMTTVLRVWQYLQSNTTWREDLERTGSYSPEQLDAYEQIAAMTEAQLRQLLSSGLSAKSREHPAFWDDRTRNNPSQPVVGLTWFEARAYCAWLSSVSGRAFRLPSEAEWEAGARGPEARGYPWGPDWDGPRANTIEGRVQRPSPVGAYAAAGGRGPFEAEDQSGNVWEWTSSLYQFAYPYRADEREDLEAEGDRVVRGGSWFNGRQFARCASRDRYVPDDFNDSLGFRVVSPVLS